MSSVWERASKKQACTRSCSLSPSRFAQESLDSRCWITCCTHWIRKYVNITNDTDYSPGNVFFFFLKWPTTSELVIVSTLWESRVSSREILSDFWKWPSVYTVTFLGWRRKRLNSQTDPKTRWWCSKCWVSPTESAIKEIRAPQNYKQCRDSGDEWISIDRI